MRYYTIVNLKFLIGGLDLQDNNKFINIFKYLSIAAFSSLALIYLIVTIISVISHSPLQVKNVSSGWIDSKGNETTLDNISISKYSTEHSLNASLTYTLSGNDESIIFRARNVFADIYVNGEPVSIDSYEQSKIFGKSPGSRWHITSLPYSDEPVTIQITATPCFNDSKGIIDNIYIGKTADIYKKVTLTRIIDFCISMILYFIGVILLIIYIILHKKYHLSKDLLYLGLATFISAQWCACESLLWQLFAGHSEAFHLISYLSIIMLPIPFAMLALYRLGDKYKISTRIYAIAVFLNFFISSFLHLTGILEFHYTIKFSHALLLILLPVGFIILESYTSASNTLKKKHTIIILGSFILLALFTVKGFYQYSTGQYGNYSSYIRIAIICFLVCLAIYQLSYMSYVYSKSRKADLMHILAITDNTTGLYNRTAFKEDEAKYNEILGKDRHIGIIQFDVNNLKKTNDTYGHEYGDMLIKTVGEGLKKCFGEYGKCYRMGGDEFMVVLDGIIPNADYDTGINNLKLYCDEINRQKKLPLPLVIAHGFVIAKGGNNLTAAMEEADLLMYKNKRMLKQQT